MSKTTANEHRFREPWLHAALGELRPRFSKVELEIPSKIRCAFGIPSTGAKSARKSECWPASASGDGHCEIFISPEIAEPLDVLEQFTHALLHACLPADAGHGPAFKNAALRLGLEGKMRHALPGPILRETLQQIAANLGPLPHARLDMSARILDRPPPADRPKKQGTRLLKAECTGNGTPCGFTVRLTGKWIKDIGLPHCPKHGAMTIKATAHQSEDAGERGAPAPATPPAEAMTESV